MVLLKSSSVKLFNKMFLSNYNTYTPHFSRSRLLAIKLCMCFRCLISSFMNYVFIKKVPHYSMTKYSCIAPLPVQNHVPSTCEERCMYHGFENYN